MNPLIVLLIILGIAAIVSIVAFSIYRFMHPKLNSTESAEEKEKKYVQEELDRILQPIEDEEMAQRVSEYKDKEDE